MIQVECSEPLSGAENMQADVRSARACLEGRDHPHLRLYSWNPAAISIGAHQSPDLLDTRMARIHGVDVVTRPTGGGAILHTDEVTYCITLPLSGRTPTQVYATITEALLNGLEHLGISADAESWPTPFSPSGTYAGEKICFSGVARDEIRVQGRKLVGSAQRIYRGPGGERVILQHGSILLSDAHTLLPVYLRDREHEGTARNVERLRARSTSLHELLGHRLRRAEIIDAVRIGFEKTPALWTKRTVVGNELSQEVIA